MNGSRRLDHMANRSRYVLSFAISPRAIVEDELYIHMKRKMRARWRGPERRHQEKRAGDCLAGHDSAYRRVFDRKPASESAYPYSFPVKEADLTPSFSPGRVYALFPNSSTASWLAAQRRAGLADSIPTRHRVASSLHSRRCCSRSTSALPRGSVRRESFQKEDRRQRGEFHAPFLALFSCEIVEYENDIQSMVNHIWNRVDAVCVEREVGKFLSKRFFQEDIVPVSESLGKKDVVLLFRKDNEELRDRFNEVIAKRVQ
jgi:hypothetical protein